MIEAQKDLEAESRALGQARYRNKRNAPWADALGPQVDEASLPPGRAMLRRVLKPTAEAIRDFLETGRAGRAGRRHVAFDLLKEALAEPEPLAYLTLRCAITAGVQGLRAQKAGRMVAKAVMDDLQAAAFARINPEGAEGLQRSLAGRARISARRQRTIHAIYTAEGVSFGWTEQQQVNVGLKLIELAAEATGLFELTLIRTKVGGKFTSEQRLQVTDAATTWLENQHERCELLDPIPLPMVIPPCPWTNPTDGGYLTPPLGSRLVRSHTAPYLQELENMAMERVYRAVNTVQATGWRINRRVLEVLDRLAADGGALAGLPPRDPEQLPERPEGAVEGDEKFKLWKRQRSEVHQRNAASRSKRMTTAQQLWVARKLIDFPIIYFPHALDWRGRVYPVPQGGPHPQAGDIGRSLLEFAEGKPLGPGGGRWLAIHIANVFGIDKVSFEDRITWVDLHRAEILDSANDPLDGKRFWTTADKPCAALAACFEWAGYLNQGEAFVSHLPIAIDGSNSGLQHLTGLMRDAEAAPHVNLIAAELPGDIYALVAAKAQAMVDDSNDSKAAPWKNGRITRGIVKRPCMTYVYSATPFGMADEIRDELQNLDDAAAGEGRPPHLDGEDNYSAASWLATRLYRLIGDCVPNAAAVMDWLKGAAKAISGLNVPLWWTTPAGLPVMQRYPKIDSAKIEVTFRGKRVQLRLDDEAGPRTLGDWLEQPELRWIDGARSQAGIAPNFVHSLDAAHLMLTVVAAQEVGITDLAVIHDSFGTYAADTDRLSAILRETFVAMYEGDPLAQFRAELVEQLTPHDDVIAALPPLPAKGSLDLKAVLDASYMFA